MIVAGIICGLAGTIQLVVNPDKYWNSSRHDVRLQVMICLFSFALHL